MTPTLALAAASPYRRAQPLPPVFFIITCIQKFVDAFYAGVLGATDFWLHYTNGSTMAALMCMALPGFLMLTSSDAGTDAAKEALIQYMNSIVSTTNPSILLDGSNADDAPPPKTNPHICNHPYAKVEDFEQDLADLIATYQCHTHCSAAYCLRTCHGQQRCWFGSRKPLQPETALVNEDGEPALLTA